MSEGIKESIPTSQDPRSKRPTKRRAMSPISEQATQIQHLMKDPTKEVKLPEVSKPKTASSLPPPPEIVSNVQGSSAGAGSGEFHVYKAARRREYERVRLMEEEMKKEKEDAEFEKKREEARRRDEEKTEKNRKKREKKRASKQKGKNNSDNASPATKDVDMKTVDERKEYEPSAEEGIEASETPGVIIHEED